MDENEIAEVQALVDRTNWIVVREEDRETTYPGGWDAIDIHLLATTGCNER